ncbi:Hypothetical predicted protein [Lecanosticta acicola]|uniref:Uncharacterized protein n=1 Tax=Lecanosticta acicola TaxID=111012 RepID=A0AAI9EBJ3_9PEZI|nr:Hypothetical predicted protein [Lecanosticta acicola]
MSLPTATCTPCPGNVFSSFWSDDLQLGHQAFCTDDPSDSFAECFPNPNKTPSKLAVLPDTGVCVRYGLSTKDSGDFEQCIRKHHDAKGLQRIGDWEMPHPLLGPNGDKTHPKGQHIEVSMAAGKSGTVAGTLI